MVIKPFLPLYCGTQILTNGVHGVRQVPTDAHARGGEILCPLNK